MCTVASSFEQPREGERGGERERERESWERCSMHHLTRRGVSGSRLDRNRYARQLRSWITIVHGDLFIEDARTLGLARSNVAIVFVRLYKVFQGEWNSVVEGRWKEWILNIDGNIIVKLSWNSCRRNRRVPKGKRDHRICVRGHRGLLDEIKLRAECLVGAWSGFPAWWSPPLSLSLSLWNHDFT